MKFNINDQVRVRLTEHGKQIERDTVEKINAPFFPAQPLRPKVEADDGSTTWQFWSLMATFGPHLSNGAEPTFVNNEIELVFKKGY